MTAVAPERPVPPLPGRGPNPAPDLPRPGEDDDGVPSDDTDEPGHHHPGATIPRNDAAHPLRQSRV